MRDGLLKLELNRVDAAKVYIFQKILQDQRFKLVILRLERCASITCQLRLCLENIFACSSKVCSELCLSAYLQVCC